MRTVVVSGRDSPNAGCIDECFVCATVKSVRGTELERSFEWVGPYQVTAESRTSNPLRSYVTRAKCGRMREASYRAFFNADCGELAVSKAPDLARMGRDGTGNYIGPYSPPKTLSVRYFTRVTASLRGL